MGVVGDSFRLTTNEGTNSGATSVDVGIRLISMLTTSPTMLLEKCQNFICPIDSSFRDGPIKIGGA
jgi:hypothetical protein